MRFETVEMDYDKRGYVGMILVIGATSQAGMMLLDLLRAVHEPARCLVRKTSHTEGIVSDETELVYGDAEDEISLTQSLKDVDYVAHIAGLWLAEPLLNACEKLGTVKRVVFVGSGSRFTKLDSPDPHERQMANAMAEAEARIKSSPTPCVILWATMIYGIHKDRNIRQMIYWMKKWPIYPNIGGGKGVKNPVYAGDVAQAILKCLFHEALPRNEYVIAGKQPIRQAILLKTIRKALRKKTWLVPVPIWLGYVGVFLYRRLYPDTHINYAMVRRLNEDVEGSIAAAAKDFGYNPMSFEEGVAKQVAYLEQIGQL
jgi:uncharacterized protein YbjT (DUF2867 family)